MRVLGTILADNGQKPASRQAGGGTGDSTVWRYRAAAIQSGDTVLRTSLLTVKNSTTSLQCSTAWLRGGEAGCDLAGGRACVYTWRASSHRLLAPCPAVPYAPHPPLPAHPPVHPLLLPPLHPTSTHPSTQLPCIKKGCPPVHILAGQVRLKLALAANHDGAHQPSIHVSNLVCRGGRQGVWLMWCAGCGGVGVVLRPVPARQPTSALGTHPAPVLLPRCTPAHHHHPMLVTQSCGCGTSR